MERIAPAQRIGEQVNRLLAEGVPEEIPASDLRGIPVRLGIRRLIQGLLEGEQRAFLGVERDERGEKRPGDRNGYEPTHLETAEGRIEVEAPQVRASAPPCESRLLAYLKGRTATLERLVREMYAHGLSTRDIEDAFTDAAGSCILSESAVSAVTAKLWADHQAFRLQRWDGVEVLCLFADALYEAVHQGGDHRDAIPWLWAICADGRKRLLGVTAGNQESREAWLEVLRGRVARGLGAPILMTSDGAPGLTAAMEGVSPEALRQRCLAHKTRNVTAKASLKDLAQAKADVQAADCASSPEVAELVAEAVATRWQPTYPAAMAGFLDDFDARVAYLRCPPAHHKDVRTTNPAERAIEEERRRTKTIPRFLDEKSGLKLCHAALLRASERRQRVTLSDFDRARLANLREQLHQECLARRGKADPAGRTRQGSTPTAA
jgi:putative transposase